MPSANMRRSGLGLGLDLGLDLHELPHRRQGPRWTRARHSRHADGRSALRPFVNPWKWI